MQAPGAHPELNKRRHDNGTDRSQVWQGPFYRVPALLLFAVTVPLIIAKRKLACLFN
jgi:hypothetical protein